MSWKFMGQKQRELQIECTFISINILCGMMHINKCSKNIYINTDIPTL